MPSVTRSRGAAAALQRSTGALSTAATARMDADLPWFRELSAEDRSWVGLIVQAGIRGFVDWYRDGATTVGGDGSALAASVFGAAPRALAGVIILQQTVDLVKLSIEVVESNVEALVDPEDAPAVRAAVSRYAREVAFATAEVYARAAEVRGAWDARLEALVVDAVLRAETDEAVLSRASALGWRARGTVVVVLGSVPARRTETDLFDEVRRVARTAGMDALCAVQGERLVVLLGGVDDARSAAARGGRPVRRRAGRGRSGRGRPRGRLGLGAGRGLGAPGVRRLAGGPATGAQQRAAARAGPGRRRPRPAAPGRGRLPAAAPGARHPGRDADRVVRQRVLDRGRGPDAVRAPQHGPLPAQAGRRADRAHPEPAPGRVHPGDRAGAGAAVGSRVTFPCVIRKFG